jgi:hypothetical protein
VPPTGEGAELGDGADWFVGYLVLDALIVNGDRHHENWAVLQRNAGEGPRSLAPSYDHASSLGRELRDEERGARLSGRDPRHTVAAYVGRARSAFFGAAGDRKPLGPRDAFVVAATAKPKAGEFWLARVAALGHNEIQGIVQAIPISMMSDVSRAFALEMMRIARERLLEGRA